FTWKTTGGTVLGTGPSYFAPKTGSCDIRLDTAIIDANTLCPVTDTRVFMSANCNQPPTATTGGPYTGVCSSVSLDRATATDPDGDAMTYTWTSTNPNISFSPATGALARGAGTKPIPPSTVTLAGSVPPCGVTAPLTLTVAD